MIPRVGRFTVNKQVVRDLQREMIVAALQGRIGNLRYFGLCSPEMKDVLDWIDLLALIVAAERGQAGREHEDQHKLRLTATRHGFQTKLKLLCGDIDYTILNGADLFGNRIPYPFDIVSLDYSGGLFYRDEAHGFYRLKAIERVVQEQLPSQRSYVFLISANCHAIDAGEVRTSIEILRTELNRRGWNADRVCNAYLNTPEDSARMKLYVPLYVARIAAAVRYSSHSAPVLVYEGNNGVEMLSFRFMLKPDHRTAMPRFPQERLNQVLNTPAIRITNGKSARTMLGVPKLTRRDVR